MFFCISAFHLSFQLFSPAILSNVLILIFEGDGFQSAALTQYNNNIYSYTVQRAESREPEDKIHDLCDVRRERRPQCTQHVDLVFSYSCLHRETAVTLNHYLSGGTETLAA